VSSVPVVNDVSLLFIVELAPGPILPTQVRGPLWALLADLVALRTKSSELTMVTGLLLTLPAIFLSTAFLPSSLLPGWLQRVADWNPAAYVIATGQRLMIGGNDWAQDLRTLAVLALATVVLLPATVAAFRAATR
jgi:ABC-2 type transport system permease protein